ncbi:hypothetical protein GCM10011584_18900 [Nocardioides phosphati]|uniref:Uncharacterized protein n=1 Tax=Nocardioides phosphati TaxID=1867775 RepID=A0ABQ2NB69_9ACTN|nr:hypothetical protein GCM10011584_18900 [Nocardioides phosphati]
MLTPVAAASPPTVIESRPLTVATIAASRATVRRVASPRARRPSTWSMPAFYATDWT